MNLRPAASPDPLDTKDAASPLDRRGGVVVLAVSDRMGATRVVPKGTVFTVGREVGCDLRLDDPSVSRRHARFVLGDELTVTDLESRNGTFVRGERLGAGERVTFAPGALLQLGDVSVIVQRLSDVRQLALIENPLPIVERAGDHEVVCVGAVARLSEIVDRVANDTLGVLLLGETGSGKDVFAELVHKRSARASAPFVRLHCAAMSETLIESEIFGHERGAFTGAQRTKPGLLEGADGGTVFIDEVGELPLAMQVKLLRVLEDKRVTRVGSVRSVRVDVRFIAATNRDLEAEVARGTFRRDLFYRLAGLVLVIPPLRERRDEIPTLTQRFLERAAHERGLPRPTIDDDAMEMLVAHDWPGNVRELRNVLERALLLGGVNVRAESLQLARPRFDTPVPPPLASAAPARRSPDEAQRILDALARTGGNQTEAARLLGISRRALINRIIGFDLPRPRKSGAS